MAKKVTAKKAFRVKAQKKNRLKKDELLQICNLILKVLASLISMAKIFGVFF